ncbi:GntR family transcriptional regulator [Clostridium sp. Marseille-P2415]|uniref:GntR family transcriptional regulator n=1 Tax=Clostridium sp. Marseille-P2415 TaxID=1805471 RepID=UPI0009888FED|nr:GntR family transcriptional regulator [Clostridium sp. Marseille-P2415]
MAPKKTPQYKQIENELLNQIRLGYYKKGDLIPTEMEFAEKYNVSRVTIRKAMDKLVNLGLLRRVSGVGTFVQEQVTKEKFPQLMGFTEEIINMGLTPRTIVTAFQVLSAPINIARILNLKEGDPIYYFKRERYANEDLFLLETSYMSVTQNPEMSIQILQGSKYQYFEKVRGEKISYNEHIITAIHPSSETAKLFRISEDTPIIKVANITHLRNGNILDYTEQIHNSPKFQLHYIKQ